MPLRRSTAGSSYSRTRTPACPPQSSCPFLPRGENWQPIHRNSNVNDRSHLNAALAKVPAVTIGFWIIKILATTLGETGGDSVTMTWLGETTDHPVPGGYLIGTAMFGIALIVLVILQVRGRRFSPWLYWATIVASTTC